jgi:hypothetical protein
MPAAQIRRRRALHLWPGRGGQDPRRRRPGPPGVPARL